MQVDRGQTFFSRSIVMWSNQYFCKVSINSCFAIDNGGFVLVHPDYINGSPPSTAEHIMSKKPAIAMELVNNGILYNDSCVNVVDITMQSFWKVSD